MRECRKIVEENSHRWETLDNIIEVKEVEEKRRIQVEKAVKKKEEYMEKRKVVETSK